VQFGARAEVSASTDTLVGRFSASAFIYFDALVQLSPFHFTVFLGGGVDVTRNGRPILRAELAATLDGPSPFHAAGYVEIHFLGTHRIGFEATSGDGAPDPPPEVDLDALVVEAVSRPDAWTAPMPGAAVGLVTLRDSVRSKDIIMVHPLGGIALQQRLLPLGKRITRFGSAVPRGGPVTYELDYLRAGNAEPRPVRDKFMGDFAPGQYDDIDGLSAPAFESMQAGGRLEVDDVRLPTDPVGVVIEELRYDETVIDSPPALGPSLTPEDVARLAAVGAAMRAPGFAGVQGLAVRVPGERFVVADADTLVATADERRAPTSSAEARDRVLSAQARRGDLVVVGAHEASEATA
jgi:hypothetical protein